MFSYKYSKRIAIPVLACLLAMISGCAHSEIGHTVQEETHELMPDTSAPSEAERRNLACFSCASRVHVLGRIGKEARVVFCSSARDITDDASYPKYVYNERTYIEVFEVNSEGDLEPANASVVSLNKFEVSGDPETAVIATEPNPGSQRWSVLGHSISDTRPPKSRTGTLNAKLNYNYTYEGKIYSVKGKRVKLCEPE